MTDPRSAAVPSEAGYDRRLGTFDATMIVVGAIVGAGIFLNPAIVAQRVGTGGMILAAWGLGGVIALLGAFCFAELGGRLPRAGGGYAYLRDTFGPLPAFLYGWTQLLVINTGGIAAVAITFASYGTDLVGAGEAWIKPVAVGAIVFLSAVNAAGVRFGSLVQNAFTLLKLAALALLVAAGVWLVVGSTAPVDAAAVARSGSGVTALGTALVAVLFAYGGWQHANNVAEEILEPERRLPRALLVGVAIVVVVYVSANAAYLAALGPGGLAASSAPAADALRAAWGGLGGVAIGLGVACSTFGILNVFILSAPRIYREMAADGLFFPAVARLHPRTRTPTVGIAIQAVWAVGLALSGSYAQLLDWVVFGDWIFFGLIAATLFVYRRRDRGDSAPERTFRAPFHPLIPGLFVTAAVFVVYSSVVSNPRNALYGTLLIGAGVPAFLFWRRGRRGLLALLLFALPMGLQAQERGALTVSVVDVRGAPVEGARVLAGGVSALSDADGRATLEVPSGRVLVRVERIGYGEHEEEVSVPAGGQVALTVRLEEEAVETEGVIVTSTRSDRRIEDEPLRVEVVEREEVEEKLLMTPGDIAMLLNETAGLRVQPTAPSLGGASVRVQGLAGRYTLLLADGLPLYGGQGGALGPLQIPPMDLGQVEVIKGVASALYGAQALGGVVNLISRRPADEREILLNGTTLGGGDAVLWAAGDPEGPWGWSLLAGAHAQGRVDVDEDAWADLPAFRRFVARPRLVWDDGAGTSWSFTVGGMAEDREGGTLTGGPLPATGAWREERSSRRADVGVLGRSFTEGGARLSLRGSGSVQGHEHRFGGRVERDRHATAFAEASLAATHGAHTWVVGASAQVDDYRAEDVPGFDYTHTVPSLFAQDEITLSRWAILSASARLDRHSAFGTSVSPRLSLLFRPAAWTVRASAGTGTFAPTPFTDEVEAVGLARLAPLPEDLRMERGRSASLDVGRQVGALELNATLFGSRVEHPLQARPDGEGRLALTQGDQPVRTWGTELLARWDAEPIHATATYVFTRATETVDGVRREVPLTPRHTVGVVAAWEDEEWGRAGVEFYYTGRQELEDDPYREASKSYVVLGFLVERRLSARTRVFLNAENLLDARQKRWAPLVRPVPTAEGRRTTDVWAPLEGRAFNAGVRLAL